MLRTKIIKERYMVNFVFLKLFFYIYSVKDIISGYINSLLKPYKSSSFRISTILSFGIDLVSSAVPGLPGDRPNVTSFGR